MLPFKPLLLPGKTGMNHILKTVDVAGRNISENSASLRIHEKAGFRLLGIREKIGKQNGIWRDTVLLERRSKLIG